MKRFSEQFNKQARLCTLTPEERAHLRERITTYMEYHPRSTPAVIQTVETISSEAGRELFYQFNIPWRFIVKGVTGVMLVVLVVVPLLAERTVPGDALYALKIGVNEEVRSTLSFTPTDRVVWETARLNRRIAEAQLLESKGELTDEVAATVAAAVKEHTQNAQREIEALRMVDSDEAALVELELATTLAVHSDALRNREQPSLAIASVGATTTEAINPILTVLTDAQQNSGIDSNGSTTLPSYEKLVARVEQHTTRLYEVLKNIEQTSTPEALSDARRRVTDIERALEAAFSLSVEDQSAAQLALVAILQRSQRLIVFLTNLEVQSQVSLESIVPIELTPEEQQARLAALRLELDSIVTELSEAVASTTPQTEKIAFTLTQIDLINERVGSSTLGLSSAELIAEVERALTLAKDAQSLLDRTEILVSEEITTPDASGVATSSATTTEVTATSSIEAPEDLTVETE
jgi:Domain of unknown function (DUF5667)